MNAKQAREESQKNLKRPVIRPYIVSIHNQIIKATKEGKFAIILSYSMNSLPWPSSTEEQAIFDHLRSEGYTIKFHEDPDLRDPRGSGLYTTVEW